MYDVVRYKTDLGDEGELIAPSLTSSSQVVTLYLPYETSYVDFTMVLEKSVDPIKARAWSAHKTGSDNRIVIPNDYFNGYYQSNQYGLRFYLDEIDPLVLNNITFATHTSPRSDLIVSGILLANDTQFTFQLYKSEEIIPVDSTQYVFDPGEIESSQIQTNFLIESLIADSALIQKINVIDSLSVCHLDVRCSISIPDPLIIDNLIVNDTLTSENNILETVEISSGVANLDSAYIQDGEILNLKFQKLLGFNSNLSQFDNNPQGSFLHVDSGLFKNLNINGGCITVGSEFTDGYKYGCGNAGISSYNNPDKKIYYDNTTDQWIVDPDIAGYVKEEDIEEILPKNLPCGILTYNSELDTHLLDTIAIKGRFVKDSAQMQLELAKPPPGWIHLQTSDEKKKFYKTFTNFSHTIDGVNVAPSDYDKWIYDDISDQLIIDSGTTSFNGVLTEYPYQAYNLGIKLSSTEATDGYIGVILAHVKTINGITGKLKENTLSALRRPTTLFDDGTKGDFIIAYNYGQSDQYILQHPDNVFRTVGKVTSGTPDWATQGETWLYVKKELIYNNAEEVIDAKFIVSISDWGSSDLSYSWEIDLLNETYGKTDLDLKQFISECKFGYAAEAGQAGVISNFVLYDMSIASSEIFQLYDNSVWTYLDTTGLADSELINLYNIQPGDEPGYYEHPIARYQDYFCTNRLLINTNPAINSIFYIKNDQSVTSPITLLNAPKTSNSFITLAIRGTGLNEHSALIGAGEDIFTGSYLLIDDVAQYGEESGINQTRGLRLTIINIDGEYNSPEVDVVSSTDYDTFGDSAASDQLAADINNMTNGQIGVITSWDAWEAEVTQALRDAARSVGLTKIANVSTIQTAPPAGFGSADIIRTPYAAIFEKNDEGAKAYEVSSGKGDENPAAFISAKITGKTFAAMGDHSANALYSYDNEDLAYIDSADKLHIDKGSVIYNGLWVDSATVARDAAIGRDLSVANDATIGNDLSVANDAAIGRDLSVANDAAIGRNLSVANDATIGNNLSVANDASITNNLDVDGDTTVADFAVDGGSTIDMGANRVTNVADPVDSQDAVTKAAVDAHMGAGWAIADGNSNSEVITLGTIVGSTVTVLGTEFEVEAVVSSPRTLTIGLPDDVKITNDLEVGNDATIKNNLTVEGDTLVNKFTVNASNDISMGNNRVKDVDTPTAGTDAVNKDYVDTRKIVIADSNGNTEEVVLEDTITFLGTAKEIEVEVKATDTVQVGLPDDVYITNNLYVGNDESIGNDLIIGNNTHTAGTGHYRVGNPDSNGTHGIKFWDAHLNSESTTYATITSYLYDSTNIPVTDANGIPASSIGIDFTADFAHFHVANDNSLLVNNNPIYHKGNLQLMQVGRWIANEGGLENELGAFLTQEQVFNTWYRFSHEPNGSYPANYTETQSWAYDTNTGQISSTVNSTSFIGFTSPAYYGAEPLEISATVYSPGADDDVIGIVVGFVVENGVEYTLSILRNSGGFPFHSGSGGFALYYNFRQSDEREIKFFDTGEGRQGWNSAGETRIGFEKNQGSLTIHCSNFGSTTFNSAYDYTIDLNSDPDLQRFAGVVSYGYCAFSQNDATFKDITEISGAGTIVDISTGTVYDQHDTSPTNRVSIVDSIDVIPGLYYNINKLVLLYKDPNGTITRIEDADPFIVDDFGGRMVNQSLLPQTDGIYDLGSLSNKWRSIYVTGNTLNMGGVAIKADSSYGFGFSFQTEDSLGGDSFGPGYIIDSASMDGKGFMIVGPDAGMFYDYTNDALYFNKEITTPTFNTTGDVKGLGDASFGGDLIVDSDALIRGNLTVQGTTTYLNTANTQIRDNVIILNGNESGNGVSLGTSGIEIERGTADNKSFLWDETNDRWSIGTETLFGEFIGNVTGQVSDISNFTTTNLTEGTNQYYTVTRANSAIDVRVTKSFVENLNISISESQITDLAHYTSTDFNTDFSNKSTTNLTEGNNLYYTTARHDSDTLALVDSSYVQYRQSYDANRIYIREAGPTSDSNIDFHIAYIRADGTGNSSGYYQLGADLDGTGFRYNPFDNELIVQKLRADDTITSHHIIPAADSTYDLGSTSNRFRDLYLSGNTIDLGGVTLKNDGGKFNAGGITLDSNFVIDIVDSTYVQAKQNYDYNSLTNLPFILDSNNVADIADSAINLLIAGAPEAFNTLKELSDAIADGDSNLTTLISSKVNQSDVITLIDSAYINARVDVDSGGSGTIDSAALELIIDSDYVNARVNTVVGNTIITSYKYIADSGQSIFTGPDANGNSLYYTDNVIIFLNGINLTQGDYTLTNNETITIAEGLDSGAELTIHKFAFSYTGTPSNPIDQFRFVADSAQTVFTDSDYSGNVLSYNPNSVIVYINGILISKTVDWTTDNDGTAITLVDAANINDEIVVINHNNISTDLDDLYVPSNSNHWNTTPTSIGEALDMLAAAFNTQHGPV